MRTVLLLVLTALAALAADGLPPALLGAWTNTISVGGVEHRLVVVFAGDRQVLVIGDRTNSIARVRVEGDTLTTMRASPGSERAVYRWKVAGRTLTLSNPEGVAGAGDSTALTRLDEVPAAADLTPLPLGSEAPDAARLAELKTELKRRFDEDQAVRQGYEAVQRSGDRQRIIEATGKMQQVDEVNTAWLREVVGRHGWIDLKRFGRQPSEHAWFLVQHSMDLRLMQAVLPVLEAEARGDAQRGQLYAMLFDRTRMQLGEGQRYGVQAAGVMAPGGQGIRMIMHIEDVERVDERRAALGLPSLGQQFGEYQQRGTDLRIIPWPLEEGKPAPDDTPPKQKLRLYAGWAESAKDSAPAQNAYAWELLTSPDESLRDPKAALAAATRAVELSKRADASILDTLALAQMRTGDAAAAVATQTEAIEKLPEKTPRATHDEFVERLQEFTKAAGGKTPAAPAADGPP